MHYAIKTESENREREREREGAIIIITMLYTFMQVTSFATTKFYVTDFVHENTQTFTHLFVANPVKKFGPFDPPLSPISYLYTTDDVLNQINFTANAVSR